MIVEVERERELWPEGDFDSILWQERRIKIVYLPISGEAFILCPKPCPKEFNLMLKTPTTTRISNRVVFLLVLLAFAVSFVHTCFEGYWINEAFKVARDTGIDIYPTKFRTSLGFTIVMFSAVLSAISSRLSKIALGLMTIIFIAYWVMFFQNGNELGLPFGLNDRFAVLRNLAFWLYQLAPLIALMAGYMIWWKRLKYLSITLAALLCVLVQFFSWFVDSRLYANSDYVGTDYQYPPITIYATFFGATWGHVILLVLCIVTMLALVILIKRDWRNEEGEKS